nr:MAG TPA: hypothetical protein [Caudoviricetes sp.]
MVITIIALIIFVLSMLIFTIQFICLAEFDKKNKFIEFVIRFVNKNSFIREIVLKFHPIIYFILIEASIITWIIAIFN